MNVAELVIEARDRFGAPAGLASDRWRESELRDALKSAGLPRGEVCNYAAKDSKTVRKTCGNSADGVLKGKLHRCRLYCLHRPSVNREQSKTPPETPS